ncbi:conserved hypothetical protein [Escherichia coli B354]|nr:conserved hypothetical protein [Escherichia coli B354]
MNGGVINTLWLVNHYRKPVFGAKLYSPDTTIVTPNANLAEPKHLMYFTIINKAI